MVDILPDAVPSRQPLHRRRPRTSPGLAQPNPSATGRIPSRR
jgi:hypothetical protein